MKPIIGGCGVLVLAVLLLPNVLQGKAEKIEVKCPEFCKCDVFENLKRAVCRNRKLVSMELNVPTQAEILDLSYNQISELGDKIFLEIGLTHLKLLNLTHNKIGQIHFNGFNGLTNLKTLDLSFNAVQYFTKSWFESLQSLEEFYLRGNKLKTINEEPVIDIKSLRVLDISKCGITSLKTNTFEHVPNLELLDISDNYLQTIQVDIVKTLPKLTNLNADHNNFNCKDKDLIRTRRYLKFQKVAFTDSCMMDVETSFSINQLMHKFEKIQMMEEAEGSVVNSSVKNSWIFDDDNRSNGTTIIEICSNGTDSDNGDVKEKTLLMEVIRLSPWLTISITFVYGMMCGMVFLYAINLCISKKNATSETDSEMPDGSVHSNVRSTQSVPNLTGKRRGRNLRRSQSILYSTIDNMRRQMSREHLEDDNFNETLMMNEFDLANSTPVAPRRAVT